jgi:IMP dehydrogenase
MLDIKEALTYDDVLLVPQYSDIKSRKEVDIGNDLDEKIHLKLPIISSPMDTVTGTNMSIAMGLSNGLGIIHRYCTIHEQIVMLLDTRKCIQDDMPLAAAIGVTGDYLQRAVNLYDAGANIICIDVAHGHHILVKNAIKTIRNELGNSLHIMAGNVATREGYRALSRWGVDSIRCNVGSGSICSTRTQTGHGIPGLHTIFECAKFKSENNTKIIADGGIRTSGDIVKALAAGADFVMLGSMLAGTDESLGTKIVTSNGVIKKEYRGMASKEAQMDWRGEYYSDEGISTMVEYKGSVEDILKGLKNGISSGLSYSGVRTIQELQKNALFIKQTNAGLSESQTHILKA